MSNNSNGQNITVGDISNSTGIAIGPHAQASVGQPPPIDTAEVIALLNDLARRVDAYEESLENAADIRESLLAARNESARTAPRWDRVRDALKCVGPAVAGISALAQAVNNIWALVSHG
jgi:uncharacterized protein DUF5955